jgi:Asp/Glu/hydantoin racemase
VKPSHVNPKRTIAVIPPIPLTIHERERRMRAYQSSANEGTNIDVRLLRGGPPLTDREYELFWATVFIILEAEAAADEGVDGIVIDCTTDPGFVEVVESLSIPVAGALRSGIARATDSINNRAKFGVIALDENWKRMIAHQIQSLGKANRLASIEVAGAHIYRPDHVDGLSSIEADEVFVHLLDAGRLARDSGSDAIVLGSTTIIDEVGRLQEVLGVPVIAPGIAALHDVEAALESGQPADRGSWPEPVYRYGEVMQEWRFGRK